MVAVPCRSHPGLPMLTSTWDRWDDLDGPMFGGEVPRFLCHYPSAQTGSPCFGDTGGGQISLLGLGPRMLACHFWCGHRTHNTANNLFTSPSCVERYSLGPAHLLKFGQDLAYVLLYSLLVHCHERRQQARAPDEGHAEPLHLQYTQSNSVTS